MEEDVEEIKSVKKADSEKSVTTSNTYSADFTDYNSDKNNSSGKETYVIDWYDSDDSEASCKLHREESSLDVTNQVSRQLIGNVMQCAIDHVSNGHISNHSANKVTIVAQETFTQTSKTIIELAKSEGVCIKSTDINTLPTQTSYVSITNTREVEYQIISSNMVGNNRDNGWHMVEKNVLAFPILSNCLEDKSSKVPGSESQDDKDEREGSVISRAETINISDYTQEADRFNTSASTYSDMEEDSLIECHVSKKKHDVSNPLSSSNSDCDSSKSISKDVEDLYEKVSDCIRMPRVNKAVAEFESQWASALTPLTEESTIDKGSIMDISPCLRVVHEKTNEIETNNTQDIEQKNKHFVALKESKDSNDPFKLPPIHTSKSSPSRLNFLLSASRDNNISTNNQTNPFHDWDIIKSDMAAGENRFINPSTDPARLPNEVFQLPPIHAETGMHNIYTNSTNHLSSSSKFNLSPSGSPCQSINIKERIKELKMTGFKSRTRRGSASPSLISSPDGSKMGDAAHKGCEALCTELLRRLRLKKWCDVLDTLEEVPRVMEKFWNVITEIRIADMIRQVTVHVDSPRSQVARTACLTLACILKNTNYTRKPDFYEAVTALLVKTGSFSRPVRRAANMALDDIVCSVDFTHAVTALCVHGVGHKSPLVRCASARLLVVCCAVSGGGRGLLRGRPPSAAAARRAALRALSDLLQDKATDARKYAERLYAMLRPLANFEAYFLTDVDVELASKQMKKYDQLLPLGPKDS